MVITWWMIALFISVFSCFMMNLNKKFQLEGLRARGWSTLCAALFLSPSLLFVELPTNPAFYLCAFIGGYLMSFIGEMTFNLSARFGGPLVSISKPFAIMSAFVIWSIITPTETLEMLSRPYVGLGIGLAFALAMWGQIRMVKESVNVAKAFKYLMAMALLGGMMSPVVKYGMSYTWAVEQMFVWTFFYHASCAFLCFCRHSLKRSSEPYYTKQFLKFGVVLGMFQAPLGALFSWASNMAPNPAFVGLVVMLSTVWLMFYYKWRKQDAHVRPKSVAMLIGAAVVLIIATKGL